MTRTCPGPELESVGDGRAVTPSGALLAGPPLHLVPDAPGHGVALFATQVATAVGARTADLATVLSLPSRSVHVHVSDSLFGATCEEAASMLGAVVRRHPTTLTLHDVPQPEDGPVFERRADAYSAVVAGARGWVTSSHHEAELARLHLGGIRADAVIPLPVMRLPRATPTSSACSSGGSVEGAGVVGVLGWVYPGKGHAEVLRACAGLEGDSVVVRALGGLAAKHERLGRELRALADEVGVGLEIAGWVPADELGAALDAVDVPVVAHRKVSASGSLNSWLGAGRRPLVTSGDYAREMAALRPGTLTLVDAGAGPVALRAAIGRALDDPGSTRLGPGTPTGGGLAATAAAYRRWWGRVR